MLFKLTEKDNGNVEVVMPAGSDYVRTEMPAGKVIGIVESSEKVEKSEMFDGFGICVDDGKYYVAGIIESDEEKSEPKPEKTYDKPQLASFKKHDNDKRKN